MGKKYRIIKQFEQQGKDISQGLAHLIKEHGTVTLVAKKLGVTDASVSYQLRKAGYARRWSRVPDDEILAKYIDLSDEQAVAEHFHIAESYVHTVLLRKMKKQLKGLTDG